MDKFWHYPSCNILIGQPSSGKTETIKHIVRQYFIKGVFHYVLVFCSEAVEHKYKSWVPASYVHTTYADEILYKFMMLQNHFKDREVNAVLIFDDIGGYKTKFSNRSELMVKLFSEHKNFNITVFVAIQSPSMISSKNIHSCIKFAWIYKQNEEEDFKDVYSHFGQKYPNWKEFKTFLDENTSDRKIVINIRDPIKGNDYKIYRHSKVPDFFLDF